MFTHMYVFVFAHIYKYAILLNWALYIWFPCYKADKPLFSFIQMIVASVY